MYVRCMYAEVLAIRLHTVHCINLGEYTVVTSLLPHWNHGLYMWNYVELSEYWRTFQVSEFL